MDIPLAFLLENCIALYLSTVIQQNILEILPFEMISTT